MELKEAVRICIKEKFATFQGRASRAECWLFFAAQVMFLTVFYAITAILSTTILAWEASEALLIPVLLVFVAVLLILFIPSLSVMARRLHDTGKSAWFLLLMLVSWIPILNFILFYFLIEPSQKMDNQYGSYTGDASPTPVKVVAPTQISADPNNFGRTHL